MFRGVTTRVSGFVILIAGLWGGLVPFVGPYFHFALGPNHSWTWTSGRFWLSVLPAIVAVIGGAMLIASGPRVSGRVGALLALAAGVWFAVGPDVSLLWHSGGAQGVAHGRKLTRMAELVTYHTGLGVLITAFAAYSLPRATVVSPVAAEPTADTPATAAPARAPAETDAPAADREPAPTREEVAARR
jgi:hypothetical protein